MIHIALPQGQEKLIILVPNDVCGVNISPKIIIGRKFTRTVALNGLIAVNGINGIGGHIQVLSFTIILRGIGGVPQDCHI
jgi:hypothetical protein